MISKEEFKTLVDIVVSKTGKTQEELALQMDYGKNYISEVLTPTGKLTPKFFKTFRLVFGEYLENPNNGVAKIQNAESYQKKRLALKNRNADITIPFYDIEAIGGKEHGADMTAITQPIGTVDIGDFLRDSKAALRVYGNSMIPNYPPGCVVGLIEKQDKYIHPGHVYVIETGNDRYVKRLYYNKDQTAYRCLSDNILTHADGPMKGEYFYPMFEILIGDVKKLYDVTGVIKRNINTIVLNR